MNAHQAKAAINSVQRDLEASYPIRLLGVFGSVVRDAAGPQSDVDILAESLPGLSLFKLGAVKLRLEDVLGRPIDLVFPEQLKPRVRERIMAELEPL